LTAEFAYLTTTGRRSGRPHVIEIWYGERDGVIYLLSGGGLRSDWVRNLRADPRVRIRIGGVRQRTPGGDLGTARIVMDPAEDATARRLLATRYQGWTQGADLSEWARTSTVVAIDRSG
jgi:deazaflavin-dependent oxidoreductase (nitroreductase family)